jgi:hypothetical protein
VAALGVTGESLHRGLTVVERDGRWYLTLLPSVFGAVDDVLAAMAPAELDALGEGAEAALADSFGMSGAADLEPFDEPGSSFDTEYDAGWGPVDGNDWPIDAAIVPVGSDAWGSDPNFSDIGFLLDLDLTAAVATEIWSADGAAVSVVTMPDASFVPALTAEAREWGHDVVNGAPGLPEGTVMIDKGDGWALYVYRKYTILTFSDDDLPLALEVLGVMAGQP